MTDSIDGFYAVYLTGSVSQGFAMLVFSHKTVIGVDAAGVKFDGTYEPEEDGFAVKLSVSIPPNTELIQGGSSGPQSVVSSLEFKLPLDFFSRQFIRIDAMYGPVNAKIVRLRELND